MKIATGCLFGASLTIVSLLLTGCSTAHTAGRPERAYSRGELVRTLRKSDDLALDQLVREYSNAETEAERKRARNKVIDTGMILMDAAYGEFIDALSAGMKGLNTASDVASITADAIATLIGPASTKAIFAAASAGIEASQSVVNRNYVYERTLPVLMTQMEAQRQSVAADLIKGSGMVTDAYPLAAALRDLERYYIAGTVDGALAGVSSGAAKLEVDSTQRIRDHQEELQQMYSSFVRSEQDARTYIATHGDAPARAAFVAWYESITDDERRSAVNRHAYSLARLQGLDSRALLRMNVLDPDDPSFAEYFDTKNYVLFEAKPEQVEAILAEYADNVMLPRH